MYVCIYLFKLFSIPMNKKHVILSVTVKINLPLKLQTDHFFVSVGKRTKSAADQICFPPTVYVLSGIWNIELLLLPQHWGTLFFPIIKFNCKVMSLCLLSPQNMNRLPTLNSSASSIITQFGLQWTSKFQRILGSWKFKSLFWGTVNNIDRQ